MRPLTLVLVLLGGVAPAFASGQQPPGAPAAKRRVDPYAKLFQQPALERVARAQHLVAGAVDAAKPRVVCGMTLIPAPNVDPKMVIEPRTDSTRYTIRAIDPPICNPAVRDR
jgi:hypothetical protein